MHALILTHLGYGERRKSLHEISSQEQHTKAERNYQFLRRGKVTACYWFAFATENRIILANIGLESFCIRFRITSNYITNRRYFSKKRYEIRTQVRSPKITADFPAFQRSNIHTESRISKEFQRSCALYRSRTKQLFCLASSLTEQPNRAEAQSVKWQGYRLDDRGSIPGRVMDSFSSPPRPDRLWGPSSLLSNGEERYPGGKEGRAWSWPLTAIYCRC